MGLSKLFKRKSKATLAQQNPNELESTTRPHEHHLPESVLPFHGGTASPPKTSSSAGPSGPTVRAVVEEREPATSCSSSGGDRFITQAFLQERCRAWEAAHEKKLGLETASWRAEKRVTECRELLESAEAAVVASKAKLENAQREEDSARVAWEDAQNRFRCL